MNTEKAKLEEAMAKIAGSCVGDLRRRVLAGEVKIPPRKAMEISRMAPPMRAAHARSYAETSGPLVLPPYRAVVEAGLEVARARQGDGDLAAALAAVLREPDGFPGTALPPLDTEKFSELVSRLDRALGLVAKVVVNLPMLVGVAPAAGELEKLRDRLGKLTEFSQLILGMSEIPVQAAAPNRLKPLKGTYVVILHLAKRTDFERVGPFGAVTLPAGFFTYTGSAFGSGGVRGRVGHHAVIDKAHKVWHLDYVRQAMQIVEVWATYDGTKRECAWAKLIGGELGGEVVVPAFGSADDRKLPRLLRCPSHFHHFAERPNAADFRRAVLAAIPGHAEIEAIDGSAVEPNR